MGGGGKLLIASQIVISLQLPFERRGSHKNSRHANARWRNVLTSIVARMIIAFGLRSIASGIQVTVGRVSLARALNERDSVARPRRGRARTAYASRSLHIRFPLYSTRGATGSARGEGGT
jgi:hypothetical protein